THHEKTIARACSPDRCRASAGRRSLDAVLLEAAEEGAAGPADHLASLIAVPAALPERLEDANLILPLCSVRGLGAGAHFADGGQAVGRGSAVGARQLEVFGAELRGVTQDPRVEEDVLELAHVARPGVRHQKLEGLAADGAPLALVPRGEE